MVEARAPIVHTKALTKAYGEHVALNALDLQIEAGATGLLGANGAGKSTLLKTLLGLIQVTSGEGHVLGHDIRTEGPSIRQRIGYMPEYEALDPRMDGIHQVRYAGELLGMNPVVAMQRAHQCLEYVGLGEQRYRRIDGYSTGMRQATKLACAIVHDPEMIIADEPSNGLDAAARDFMLQTLDTTVRNGQRSVLMASHLMDDVEQVCERIVLLHKGRLVAEGKIEDLKAIDREYEVHVWGAADAMERGMLDRGLRVRRQGRVMRVADDRDDVPREVLEVAASTGAQVRRLHTYEASLEDLFIAIMERLGHDVKSSEDLLAGGRTG